jgi:6-phosphogluconate dehydrogenase (decarboxylating)
MKKLKSGIIGLGIFMDVGALGGMEGARHGACYMIGGDLKAWDVVELFSEIQL